jgi:hypothetical protein
MNSNRLFLGGWIRFNEQYPHGKYSTSDAIVFHCSSGASRSDGMVDKDAPPSMASGADLISSLSDGLREQVLSFLPTHEAVRTAVLALSWRNVWMRSLALNITDWGTSMFTKFVFCLLRLRAPTSSSCTTGN